MNTRRSCTSLLTFLMATIVASPSAWSDGGYFVPPEGLALSADQQAVIIKNGDEISMTLSTGYTGDGGEFVWIIPTPEPPLVDDVLEPGEDVQHAMAALHEATHPAGSLRYAGLPYPFEAEVTLAPVTVYGTVTLDHYDIAIVGSEDPNALVHWLQDNGFSVPNDARDVLGYYTQQNWAFVAAKLRPSGDRHYDNEPLAPLTIRYRSDELVYPLLISLVSTGQAARITLYVIAESTVTSKNFETVPMRFTGEVDRDDKVGHVEATIRRLAGEDGRRLVVAYSGKLPWTFEQSVNLHRVANVLMRTPYGPDGPVFVTRLEGFFQPAAMTQDIRLSLDPEPNYFYSHLTSHSTHGFAFGIEVGPEWLSETDVFRRDFCLTTRLSGAYYTERPSRIDTSYRFLFIQVSCGIDLLWSHVWADGGPHDLTGAELTLSNVWGTIGLGVFWDITAREPLPSISLRFRLFDVPPMPGFSFDVMPLAIRVNMNTGAVQSSWGIGSVGVGFLRELSDPWWEP